MKHVFVTIPCILCAVWSSIADSTNSTANAVDTGKAVQTSVNERRTFDRHMEDYAVSNDVTAKELAFRAYEDKVKRLGKLALQYDLPQLVDIIMLTVDVPDFGAANDLIWEVRITNLGQLRAIVWVHPTSARPYLVCGPWDTWEEPGKRVLGDLPSAKTVPEQHRKDISGDFSELFGVEEEVLIHIKERVLFNVDVWTEGFAVQLAGEADVAVDPGFRGAFDKPTVTSTIILGYDVPGFAAEGEVVWEARIDNRKNNKIFWINPRTKTVYYVWGI